MGRKIMVVTTAEDPVGAAVHKGLVRRGHDPITVYPSEIPASKRVAIHSSDRRWRAQVETRDGWYDLTEVGVVWWRKPGRRTFPSLPPLEAAFALREANEAMTGMWGALTHSDIFWMSHPHHIMAASNRVEQLHRALYSGFAVPQSIVTNDQAAVQRFARHCGRVLVPTSMSDPEYPETSEVPVGPSPTMFQEQIRKRHELRVTVIGDQVFTAVVSPRAGTAAGTDSRIIDMRAGEPADDIAQRCIEFVRGYGLQCATLDFAVTPDGATIFLGMDPNGSWMQGQSEVPETTVMRSLIGVLVRHANV